MGHLSLVNYFRYHFVCDSLFIKYIFLHGIDADDFDFCLAHSKKNIAQRIEINFIIYIQRFPKNTNNFISSGQCVFYRIVKSSK